MIALVLGIGGTENFAYNLAYGHVVDIVNFITPVLVGIGLVD
jgi:Ca2+/H+ antiporter